MTTFARSTFSHSGYAAFRPSYPPSLFRTVLAYHDRANPASSPGGTLLDLGCGHGLIARALAPHFSRVVGLDPSAGMVAQAQRLTPPELASKVEFKQGSAEDLRPFFARDASVHCAVAGQAAHWFDYARAWPELARVVRSGGTLAFWGYKDHVVVGAGPRVAEVFYRYTYSEGEPCPGIESMARFWEQPGRNILRDSLGAVEPPEKEWEDVRRIVWDPDRETGGLGENPPEEAMWQRKTMKLGELEGYVRTYSSFKGWQDAYPELKSRADGGKGDVVDRMFDEAVDAVPEWKQAGDKWRDVEVDVIWGTVILLATRR